MSRTLEYSLYLLNQKPHDVDRLHLDDNRTGYSVIMGSMYDDATQLRGSWWASFYSTTYTFILTIAAKCVFFFLERSFWV